MKNLVFLFVLIIPVVCLGQKYNCKNTDGRNNSVTLEFDDKDKLQRAIFYRFGTFKITPKRMTRTKDDAKFITGTNSSEEYQHIQWEKFIDGMNYILDVSYKTKVDGKELSLDESIVGTYENQVTGGKYGKLRVDYTIDDEYGSTYHFDCMKKKK